MSGLCSMDFCPEQAEFQRNGPEYPENNRFF